MLIGEISKCNPKVLSQDEEAGCEELKRRELLTEEIIRMVESRLRENVCRRKKGNGENFEKEKGNRQIL